MLSNLSSSPGYSTSPKMTTKPITPLRISSSPDESQATIRALSQANLLSVFNERDETARKACIQSIYGEDIVWYEADNDVRTGYAALNRRVGELLGENPAFAFRLQGDTVVAQNLGIQNWSFGPPVEPDLIKGTDVIIVQDGRVRALWTAVTKGPVLR